MTRRASNKHLLRSLNRRLTMTLTTTPTLKRRTTTMRKARIRWRSENGDHRVENVRGRFARVALHKGNRVVVRRVVPINALPAEVQQAIADRYGVHCEEK